MTSPKITEGVMGVMKNPQNESKMGVIGVMKLSEKLFLGVRICQLQLGHLCPRSRRRVAK